MEFLLYLIGFCADCAIAAALAIAFIRRAHGIVVRRS